MILSGTLSDVSEEKMNLEGLFRFSIENALELFICFDEDGVILYANSTAQQQLEYE